MRTTPLVIDLMSIKVMCFVGAKDCIKIFIERGARRRGVRQFQPGDWKRQFSIKDADYGELVLKQLATVL